MNRIRSIGRFASLLPELFSAGPDPAPVKTHARYRAALVAVVAGLVVPLAATLPATAAAAGPGTTQPDTVT